MNRDVAESKTRAAGYEALTDRYGLDVIPNWHRSRVGASGARRVVTTDSMVEETYPSVYWPGESLGEHLEFALKYDGTNLGILSRVFSVADVRDIRQYVESKPVGKYARRIWYLYEFLTGKRLPLADLKRGNYVNVLDTEAYYASESPRRVSRQRVNDNLLGDRRFCPMIRRTATLKEFESAGLQERCRDVVAGYPNELLRRALGYLYTKETKSSFEIESVKPSSTRIERFIALLKSAEEEDFCNKSALIELQQRIVEERYRSEDYRSFQNYVGESVSYGRERVHYVCPRPEEIHDLMAGLIEAHQRMTDGLSVAVVHAAAVAYGFVYLHPFEDGNGRIHRFLIHNILSRRGFTPPRLMFPVSAAMLKDPAGYDASLEAFSRPIMQLVEYELDENGKMHVENDVATWYAQIDLTAQAEGLCRFVKATIETELVEELAFLSSYDETKRAIQEFVDMPDRRIDLFIKFCIQNRWRLSARKRAEYFPELTDEEIGHLEGVVRSGYRDAGHVET